MNFIGTGKRLTDLDLPRIGNEIGVGEDEIHAVLDVECRGKGFDSKNRPVILFEPHIFYRELPSNKRATALSMGLARKKWVRDYPNDSYTVLDQAIKIDETAALKSCSWGLGQVMGFNHKLAGYASVQDMVDAFKASEGNQLQGMVNFIKNTGLDAALQKHDWHAFAKGYNGSGYATHGYHTRLEAAYQKWVAIPDTEWKRTLAIKTTTREPLPAPVATEVPSQGIWAALASLFMSVLSALGVKK